MTDPIRAIEDAKMQEDIGVVAARIYHGARTEGATRAEAFTILLAWFKSVIALPDEDDEDE